MAGPNPFEDALFGERPDVAPAKRIRDATKKIRSLRGQIAHDGLTPSASRTLLDELTKALEACAEALDGPGEDRERQG